MAELCDSLQSQVAFGVLCLLILNVVFYNMVSHQTHGKDRSCKMDEFLIAVTKYLQTNGEFSLEQAVKEGCPLATFEKGHALELQKILEDGVLECSIKQVNSYHMRSDMAILTLFTTWPSNERDKDEVHKKTVTNWSAFQPRVNVVLFTNDTQDRKFVEERGWSVFPITHHFAGGAPVFRTMFQTVIQNFNSSFYGFANSDILFSNNVIDTLLTVRAKFGTQNPVFVSGRRFNVDHVTEAEAASLPNIHKAAMTRGTLFEVYSEDYFISSASFPWNTVPDLVVGRPAYDNWIVAHARCINTTVIDTTDTLTAVHQTTETGNKEGFKRPASSFNDKLLQKLKINRNYESGFITCPEWKSYESLCGSIEIYKRPGLPAYCKCS